MERAIKSLIIWPLFRTPSRVWVRSTSLCPSRPANHPDTIGIAKHPQCDSITRAVYRHPRLHLGIKPNYWKKAQIYTEEEELRCENSARFQDSPSNLRWEYRKYQITRRLIGQEDINILPVYIALEQEIKFFSGQMGEIGIKPKTINPITCSCLRKNSADLQWSHRTQLYFEFETLPRIARRSWRAAKMRG